MIEICGKDIVAEVKARCQPYSEELADKRIVIMRFHPSTTATPEDITKVEAARLSSASKIKTFRSVGCITDEIVLDFETGPNTFARTIDQLNRASEVVGIIVQNPVPAFLQKEVAFLDVAKDLDGAISTTPHFSTPATSETIFRLVSSVASEHDVVAVVGHQGYVGAGVVKLLQREGIEHFGIEQGDPLTATREATIVVTATGVPELLDERHIVPSHRLVVDAGFVPREGQKPLGDVNRRAYPLPAFVVPVPGGVGPLQMATLLERLVERTTGEQLTPWRYAPAVETLAVECAPLLRQVFRRSSRLGLMTMESEQKWTVQGKGLQFDHNPATSTYGASEPNGRGQLFKAQFDPLRVSVSKQLNLKDYLQLRQLDRGLLKIERNRQQRQKQQNRDRGRGRGHS